MRSTSVTPELCAFILTDPKPQVQLCNLRLVRHSQSYVREGPQTHARRLKTIYGAATAGQAAQHTLRPSRRSGMSPTRQRRNWGRVIPFFSNPADIHKVIYTIKTIGSVNISLRKKTKNPGSFPSNEAITKPVYLASTTSPKNRLCRSNEREIVYTDGRTASP